MELVCDGGHGMKHVAVDGGRWPPELFVGARSAERAPECAFAG
jgi:hypothetical protein